MTYSSMYTGCHGYKMAGHLAQDLALKETSFLSTGTKSAHECVIDCIATLFNVRCSQWREICSQHATFTGWRERHKPEKSEEKIDCHHQDSKQGPSLVASDALTTELWCSRHPSRDNSTFSSDFVTHVS